MSYIQFDESKNDFEKVIEENKKNPTFVDFSAPWCGPCKALKPIIEKVCKDNGFNLIYINVDENLEIVENYEIKEVPYVILYIDGKKVFDFKGMKPEQLDKAVKIAKKY